MRVCVLGECVCSETLCQSVWCVFMSMFISKECVGRCFLRRFECMRACLCERRRAHMFIRTKGLCKRFSQTQVCVCMCGIVCVCVGSVRVSA